MLRSILRPEHPRSDFLTQEPLVANQRGEHYFMEYSATVGGGGRGRERKEREGERGGEGRGEENSGTDNVLEL